LHRGEILLCHKSFTIFSPLRKCSVINTIKGQCTQLLEEMAIRSLKETRCSYRERTVSEISEPNREGNRRKFSFLPHCPVWNFDLVLVIKYIIELLVRMPISSEDFWTNLLFDLCNCCVFKNRLS